MPIKRSSIENLKSRVNLLDVAGKYTQLKKRGNSYVGLSPFVKEKSPSFYVEPAKNVFYCFSTNRGGDLISFVQEMEKLEFYEAVEMLAERFNIPLEYEEGTKGAPKMDRSLKKELMEIHLYAAEFFAKAFNADHIEAKAVREYWTKERKFSLEVAKDFQVGYAPANSNKLWELLQKKEFSIEAIKQSGLYFNAQKPRFRGRLMIPLRDSQGNVIAFTGRKLMQTPQDDPAFEAKYVNSPETPLFKKGAMLFNFDRAREAVSKQGFFLMVEGQLDAIRVATSGFPAVIAPQGTAITPEQLGLIKRYDARLKVFLDGDRAGQAAALRALPMALAAELDISFIKLPAGVDPDGYFKENIPPPSPSQKEGNKLLGVPPNAPRNSHSENSNTEKNAVKSPLEILKNLEELGPIDFAVQALWPQNGSSQARTLALKEIFELIATTPSAITQEAYLDELIRKCKLEATSVRKEFLKVVEKTHKKEDRQENTGENSFNSQNGQNKIDKKESFNKNLTTAEFELLWLLTTTPVMAPKLAEILEPAWLDEHDFHSNLLNRVLAEAHEGAWEPPVSIEHVAHDDESRRCLYGLLARPLPSAMQTKEGVLSMVNGALKAIFNKYVAREKIALREALKNARNQEEEIKIQQKQQKLLNFQRKVPYLTDF